MKLSGLSHLLVEQIAVIAAILAYLSGIVTVRPQISPVEDGMTANEYRIGLQNDSQVVIDKTVLIVIDALRADHLSATNQPLMPYVHGLITKGEAFSYVLRTATPTVTLPRIKSLVTGTIPGFMDVIDNFGAGELTDDNLIQRWVDKGKRVHFFGDETWVKLFPTQFSKQDTVTSFFVTDYTEVDRNVTRNVQAALASSDWDVLVLHYLGLDHIGHTEGPMSPHVGPKLLEMDKVMKEIHTALEEKGERYLITICGDHGMSDAGGHGGSSHSEVTTSAVLLSNTFGKFSPSKTREVKQVDLASTLALLTGVPIPDGNIGRPLTEVFSHMGFERRMLLHHNAAKQLLAIAKGSSLYAGHENAELIFEEATRLHKQVLQNVILEAERVCRFYQECQEMVSDALSSKLQSYDLTTIFASTFAVILTFIVCLWRLLTYPPDVREVGWVNVCWCMGGTFLAWLLCCATVPGSCVCHLLQPTAWLLGLTFVYVLVTAGQVFLAGNSRRQKRASVIKPLHQFLLVGTGFHTLSLLGTSLVEEEHQTVYFLVNSLHVGFVICLIVQIKRKVLMGPHSGSGRHGSDNFDAGKYKVDEDELDEDVAELPTRFTARSSEGLTWMQTLRRTPVKLLLLSVVSLSLSRLMRSWNSTGDKWKHLEDLGDGIRAAGGYVLLAVVLAGLVVALFMFSQNCLPLVMVGCACIFGRHFPLSSSGGVLEAQFAHFVIFILFVYGLLKAKLIDFKTPNSRSKSNLDAFEPEEEKMTVLLRYSVTALSLLCLLLQRADNIGLLALVMLQNHIMSSVLCKLTGTGLISSGVAALAVNWLAFAHFFYQGNSNSLATVDISAGFVGVTSYRPFVHGALIATQTFGGTFLTYLTYLMNIISRDAQKERWQYPLYVWWTVRLATMSLYLVNVTFQRYHLFIWSVFTPKLLYEGAHLLVLCVLTLFMWSVEKICTVLEVSYRFE
ncbi:GPI ethanolamine phosphate transferase 2-like [Penaeus japonicus]|uniref:GPI ethanolamine phosphate transferase 2-like n=1 Tax=Penaeus japonicus TaxID=27405 RepID=UPI001C70CCEE|nr:GPI ethanolamine phosphate transferase 2-like [Penaeus japonicus]